MAQSIMAYSAHHTMRFTRLHTCLRPCNSPFSINAQARPRFRILRATTDATEECNEEACAPEKEIGKVSMEWVAGDRTKVLGTFPPKSRKWTGYIEKDTAGQTNVFSVEPTVYVAESAMSSGSAGTSAEGSENIVAISAGLAVILIAGASLVLLQVGKNQPVDVAAEYSGPPLSYYIKKFDNAISMSSPPVTSESVTPVFTKADEKVSQGLEQSSDVPVASPETDI